MSNRVDNEKRAHTPRTREQSGKTNHAGAMGLVALSFGLVGAPILLVSVEGEVDWMAVNATVSMVVGGCPVRGMSEMNLMQRHTLRRTDLGGEVLRHCLL